MSHFYNDSELQDYSYLVLCIEEHEDEELGRAPENLDTRMFVYYDHKEKMFHVFGRRQDKEMSRKEYVPYHFATGNKKALFEFVNCATGDEDNKKSLMLYNFNNMYDEDTGEFDTTYEFLEENMDSQYEIAAYDLVDLDRKMFMKYALMLKQIH